MSTHPAYALQVAVDAVLSADSGVTALVAADHIVDPHDASDIGYPMIQIGDDQVIGDDNTCYPASDATCNIHVWTQGRDARLKAKQIVGEVDRVLKQPFALDGFKMTSAVSGGGHPVSEGDATDPDTLVAHYVQTFHYRIVPANP